MLFMTGCVTDLSSGPGLGGLPLPFGIFGNSNNSSYYDRNTYYTNPPPNRYGSPRYSANSRKVYYNSPTQYYERSYAPRYSNQSYNRSNYYNNNRYRSSSNYRNNSWNNNNRQYYNNGRHYDRHHDDRDHHKKNDKKKKKKNRD